MADFPLAVRTEKNNLLSGFGSRLIVPFSMPDPDWSPGHALTWFSCIRQSVKSFKDLGSAVSCVGGAAWSLSGSSPLLLLWGHISARVQDKYLFRHVWQPCMLPSIWFLLSCWFCEVWWSSSHYLANLLGLFRQGSAHFICLVPGTLPCASPASSTALSVVGYLFGMNVNWTYS